MPRILIVVVLAAGIACATNPATGKRQLMLMSEAQEIQLGQESDQQVRQEMGVYHDDALQKYIDGIGQRLRQAAHRPTLPWKYTVVDSQAVNAFALPGGYIYITRGILPFLRDEAELAAVLGHETGHVDARHSAAAYSKQTLIGGSLAVGGALFRPVGAAAGAAGVGLGLVFLKNSRDNEVEADRLGVGYASTSGWTAEAMQGLLGTLGRLEGATGSSRGVPNWALTHPPAEDRVARVDEAVAAARASGGTATNRTEFERHLDGLVFGDSREQGIVRGSEFLHPILRLAVKFPDGWTIANGATSVTASRDENGGTAMVLQVVDGAGTDPADVARQTMTKAGLVETSGRQSQVNGLVSYGGVYEGAVDGTRIVMRAAFIRVPSLRPTQFVVVAGVATSQQFAGVEATFAEAIESFRPLSQREADGIQPNRVDFYVVRGGDTWDSIAKLQTGGTVKAATLAIMNGELVGSSPRPGSRIRVIVGG